MSDVKEERKLSKDDFDRIAEYIVDIYKRRKKKLLALRKKV